MPLRLQAFVCTAGLLCALGSSSAQQPFRPAAFQSAETPERLAKINRRLERDIAGLAALPKDHKAAITAEYTERADSIKSELRTGDFLLDSVWTSWFDGVLQEIYSNNPSLPAADVSFYIGRGEEPNAWSVGEGSIVFNIGLLPYMENESQVAFIVCHELAHFVRNHGNQAIERYVNNLYSKETQKKLKSIERGRVDKEEKTMGLLKGMTYSSRRHSRFKESEADSLGFVLLSHTRYAPSAAWGALRMLDSIDHLNWPPIAYKTLLDAPQFPFQDAWLTGPAKSALSLQAAALQEERVVDDSLRTHPDCQKRMELIKKQAGKPGAGSLFVQPEANFQQLKTWSQYELIENSHHFRDYGRSLFRTLELLQEHPDDAWLNAMVVRNFYYIHRYQKAHQLRTVLDLPKPGYSKEYQKFLQFANRLQLSEMAKIGYYFCENRLDKYASSEDFAFAAVLASHMMAMPDVFKTRKAEYLQRFPNGQYVATVSGLE